MEITIETRVTSPVPTSTGVLDGVDYDAELSVTDETGETYRWQGGLTYAPDRGRGGGLVPYGNGIDHWMCGVLVVALRTPWIAAHDRLVAGIIRSLGDGPGVETITVEL